MNNAGVNEVLEEEWARRGEVLEEEWVQCGGRCGAERNGSVGQSGTTTRCVETDERSEWGFSSVGVMSLDRDFFEGN
jgi:hypothetical protein